MSIANNAHHWLKESFPCAQVPVLKTRHQIDIEVCLLVQHMHNFVAGTGYTSCMLRSNCFKYFVHAFLIFIHWATNPKIVVLIWNTIFCWKGSKWGNSLKSLKLSRKLVFNENSTLRCSEVRPALFKLLFVKGFMDYTYSWSAIYCNTYHACYVI